MSTERKECWFTETANKFLANYLRDNFPVIFEFGMGSSTFYLAKECAQLVSIDNDKEWFRKVSEKISKTRRRDHVTLIFSGELPYNNAIEDFKNNYFDIIIVDGRNRVKCIQSAIPHVKKGGMLILDNSEREYYKAGIDLMKDWNRIDFRQNRPDKYGFTYPDWTTSIFIKP